MYTEQYQAQQMDDKTISRTSTYIKSGLKWLIMAQNARPLRQDVVQLVSFMPW